MSAWLVAAPGEVRSGMTRRPAVIGRTIFEYADELAIQMPASCQRSGCCHECVELTAGAMALSEPTEPESFLRPPYRLACQALIARTDAAIEFRPLRRRLRILLGQDEAPFDGADGRKPIDSPVRRHDGKVTYEGAPLDVDRGRALGLAIDVGTTTVVVELVDLESGGILGAGAFENPQAFGGSDVMNRISYDERAPGELRRALSRALNQEIRTLSLEIGFVAEVDIARVRKLGNVSIRGARGILLSRQRREAMERLVRRIDHVELETTPDFFELFVEACQFKPMVAA